MSATTSSIRSSGGGFSADDLEIGQEQQQQPPPPPQQQNPASTTNGNDDNNSDIVITTTETNNPNPLPENPTMSERYGSSKMPEGMEDFLCSQLLSSQKTRTSTLKTQLSTLDESNNTHASEALPTGPGGIIINNHGNGVSVGSIFETPFDLTEARLRTIFDMFDTDGSGAMSYDEMKRGLEYHVGSALSNALAAERGSFEQLLSYLDADGSGDVTFEEFSEGIRLLMLRSLLRTAIRQERRNEAEGRDSVVTEVLDYNGTRLERHVVEGYGRQGTMDLRTSTSVEGISVRDFFFADRYGNPKLKVLLLFLSSSF
jgi:hypothetical protein